jgi:hypothetical protein
VPSTLPADLKVSEKYWSTLATTACGAGFTAPAFWLTSVLIRPGWGTKARSGGDPACTRTGSCSSNSFEPS